MFYRRYKRNKGKGSGDSEEEPIIPQFNPFVFLLPAVCDIVATCILYVGLNLTTARALIVCTGLLSIFLINAQIEGYKWLGMLIVVLGLVIVGVTDFLFGEETEEKKEGAMIGNILCVVAQIAVALQLVLEQKYLHMHDVHPLFAVGLEGIYGLIILGIGMVPLYYIHVPPTFSSNPEGRLESVTSVTLLFDFALLRLGVLPSAPIYCWEFVVYKKLSKMATVTVGPMVHLDVIFAWKQICMEPMISVSLAAMIISIAFFNFSAITVTKELTATTRTVIDSIRTILIWGASIPLFHEKFIPYQKSTLQPYNQ
ncbi:hypothetical protein ANCDUO_02512 [Ancylostoma duodenale]|uniref:EamA domain-containing protein n=1 Tax=Ancylostoma duodenale TaxID=51022 RepID=A0A0C2HCA9_9BILA|nr:hypothetical protein ANCDUO_02512 [Ancylostoma duodenale]